MLMKDSDILTVDNLIQAYNVGIRDARDGMPMAEAKAYTILMLYRSYVDGYKHHFTDTIEKLEKINKVLDADTIRQTVEYLKAHLETI